MAETIIRQGEDVLLKVDIMDGTTPVVLNPTNINNIVAVLYVANTEVAKYSLNSMPGHGTLDYHPTQNNSINIVVEREQSKNFNIGVLKVVVLIQFIDPEFPDGKHREFVVSIGRVIKGESKDIDI
ncbi:MAG: hypothetical protein NZ519_12025 [Bacteroidia bacterium]|nr:hypothetical protein [Bacteroidia bacterium]